MLNLPFAMVLHRNLFAVIGLFMLAWPASFAPAPLMQSSTLSITSPINGDVLQGVVSITGTTDLPGFTSSEISFGYSGDPTSTWFLIAQNSQPVITDVLASWDTSTITDGDYRLRLQVFSSGGQVQEILVEGLRVRNYTLIETSTPAPQAVEQVPAAATQTLLPDYMPKSDTPTPLPTNPAVLTEQDLQASALTGAAVVLVGLVAAGLYLGIRFLFR